MAYWNGSSEIKSAWTRRNAVFKAVCCTSGRVSVFCVRHLMTYYIHVWLTCGQSVFRYIMYCVRISCWVAKYNMVIPTSESHFWDISKLLHSNGRAISIILILSSIRQSSVCLQRLRELSAWLLHNGQRHFIHYNLAKWSLTILPGDVSISYQRQVVSSVIFQNGWKPLYA